MGSVLNYITLAPYALPLWRSRGELWGIRVQKRIPYSFQAITSWIIHDKVHVCLFIWIMTSCRIAGSAASGPLAIYLSYLMTDNNDAPWSERTCLYHAKLPAFLSFEWRASHTAIQWWVRVSFWSAGQSNNYCTVSHGMSHDTLLASCRSPWRSTVDRLAALWAFVVISWTKKRVTNSITPKIESIDVKIYTCGGAARVALAYVELEYVELESCKV